MSDVISIPIGEHIDIVKGKKPKQLFDLPIDEFTKPYVLAEAFDSKEYSNFTDDTSCKICEEEDVLLLWDGSRAGRVAIGLSGYIGSTIAALKLKNKNFINPLFLYYNLKFKNDYIAKNTAGTGIPHVQKDIIQNLNILLFPIKQQEKIASILSSVDEAIEKTEAIFEKTEEAKKGLMQQLLTKGIGHTKFKKTDIGEIPEVWDVKQLGEITEIKGRIGWKGYTKEDLRQSGPLVLGATQINSRYKLDLKNPVYLSQEKYEESPEIMVSMGDIILVQRGSTIGKVALIDKQLGEATINPSMVLLKNIKINSVFLNLFLSSQFVQKRLAANISQTSIPMISQKQISGISIGIPSYDEQCKIAEIIQSIEGKISAEERELSKLRTLKKGLMQILLTGKVRVKSKEAEVTQE
ncbi:restriction endonuclease subunit S [Bacillus sp. FSL L8-0152]|uniref:restriction endonuclease subunit S n=1 Tax=Bacillus sp. FSL L8-0152 TaxID=2921516 RepID=UPI0030F5CEB6